MTNRPAGRRAFAALPVRSLLLALPSLQALALLGALAAARAAEAHEGMAHGDHTPKHGGQFFMAGNGYHHVEGTLPEPGLFRLYFYDDFTKPIDAKGTKGTLTVRGGASGSPAGLPLVYEPATKALVARLPAQAAEPEFPFELRVDALLRPPSARGAAALEFFDFVFGGTTPPDPRVAASGRGARIAHAAIGEELAFGLEVTGASVRLFVSRFGGHPLDLSRSTAALHVLLPDRRGAQTIRVPLAVARGHFTGALPEGAVGRGELVVVAEVAVAGRLRVGRLRRPATR